MKLFIKYSTVNLFFALFLFSFQANARYYDLYNGIVLGEEGDKLSIYMKDGYDSVGRIAQIDKKILARYDISRIFFSPDNKWIVAANRTEASLGLIDISNPSKPEVVLDALDVRNARDTLSGFRPQDMVFSENSQFVAIRDSRDVIVLDLETITANLDATNKIPFKHARSTLSTSFILDNDGKLSVKTPNRFGEHVDFVSGYGPDRDSSHLSIENKSVANGG